MRNLLLQISKGVLDRRASSLRYPPVNEFVLYCIGDIHGRLDRLEAVHALIDADALASSKPRVEIYLGDFVDRGPDSAGVITSLISRMETCGCVFIMGNHERLLLDALDGKLPIHQWRAFGADPTALSYGLDPRQLAEAGFAGHAMLRAAIPHDHRTFLDNLLPFWHHGSYLFVHAGVRPGIGLHDQNEKDLLWIRSEFLRSRTDFGAVIVHGHTPCETPELWPNRVNLDTGAYATGRLSCARIDETGLRIIT